MPGYVIHLATAYVHLRTQCDVRDAGAFLRGVIAPDQLLPKTESHFGDDTANPGLDLFADTHDMRDDYQRGYFLHLLADYLFYNRFLSDFVWSPAVYDDYDRLNARLVEAYGVAVPEEVRGTVGFRDDDLEVFRFDRICGFIDTVGAIDLDELLRTRDYDGIPLEKHGA